MRPYPRIAVLALLATAFAAGACGGTEDRARGADDEAVAEQGYDPMRMEGEDSAVAAAAVRAHSDSVREEALRQAGVAPEADGAPPPAPAEPAIQNREECLARANEAEGGERDLLRSTCMRLPEGP
ncbi:MAG TPA: hypothetical protein VF665_00225 [Longimicrobium sp.]|jgi:hypothetical protein|uniref:hypothetical protein n=1 Tax=Longimicrobium sp. TaxID=2029185 RepID=UPI002ED88B72